MKTYKERRIELLNLKEDKFSRYDAGAVMGFSAGFALAMEMLENGHESGSDESYWYSRAATFLQEQRDRE